MRNSQNDDINLLVEIAYLYYELQETQHNIGKKFNISRSLVSRYLSKARELGIIEIIIHDEISNNNFKLEKQFKDKFKLKDVIIVESSEDPLVQSRRLANAANRYFLNHFKNGDTVAISGGTTINEMTNFISSVMKFPKSTFVSITGGLGGESRDIQSNIICEKFANKLDAKAKFLYAPVLLDSLEAKEILLSQSFIRETLDVGLKANILLAGIGGSPIYSTLAAVLKHHLENDSDSTPLDIVGDFCYNFFDDKGKIINCHWNDRVVTLGAEMIKNIPLVIAVATGLEKVNSIKATLKGQFYHTLITDTITANEILRQTM